MIGVISYGGYIPRLRLERMSIFKNMGWFNPAIVMLAQGERSFCNWDEDSLTMAVAASRDCLSGEDKSAIDTLYLCSTTLPFADRLNAGILKAALNLKNEIRASDSTSSLRAGTTSLIDALNLVRNGSQALVTASDKRLSKTATNYEMWFGDGAASLLVGDSRVIAEFLGAHSVTYDFIDHYRGAYRSFDYMWEERWVRDEGYGKIIPETVNGLLRKLSITMEDVDKLIFPCYFKAEHRNIGAKLGATPEKVMDNLHEVCGETGAAHPLVMFIKTLQESAPGDRILLAGFGQGCDALYFRVTDAIRDLQPRQGIKGALAKKESIDNYTKFLKFRGLLETDMGIRAEASLQTALTVLWRNREGVLGLVGGRCRECGTPQFPMSKMCINPKCLAVDAQEPYEFADIPAYVKTFTGDHLAVSVDPPAIYGFIQFEGGGRFMANFTDCKLSDVYVGQQVDMSFRKHYSDEDRGFTAYFWKAVPSSGDRIEKLTGEK